MAREPFPSETADRYIVRFPAGMRDRIKALAEESGRSMNAQIVMMIEFAMDEMELSAGTYNSPPDSYTPIKHLKSELRKAKTMLEGILGEMEQAEKK